MNFYHVNCIECNDFFVVVEGHLQISHHAVSLISLYSGNE